MNGDSIMLNADLIETVEARPDTLITLITGNRIMVKEKVPEIVEKVREYRKSVNMVFSERMAGLGEEAGE